MSNKIPEKTKVKGNRNEQKGKLKKKFSTLTDNSLLYEQGKKDEMRRMPQVKLSKSKEELVKIIESL